jgi:hypothetical protein
MQNAAKISQLYQFSGNTHCDIGLPRLNVEHRFGGVVDHSISTYSFV